jgi:hypothetical protein
MLVLTIFQDYPQPILSLIAMQQVVEASPNMIQHKGHNVARVEKMKKGLSIKNCA